MDSTQFDKLEEKIGLALRAIQDLKRENARLQSELQVNQEQVHLLRESLGRKEQELEMAQSHSQEHSHKMEMASSKLQDLISKLESESLELPSFTA